MCVCVCLDMFILSQNFYANPLLFLTFASLTQGFLVHLVYGGRVEIEEGIKEYKQHETKKKGSSISRSNIGSSGEVL